MKRLLSALTITASLTTALPAIAQSLPGFTIFGGPQQINQLNFRLDSGKSGSWDRYNLRIPAKKLNLAIAQISIAYPEYYRGRLNADKVSVKVDNKTVAIEDVIWDKENHFLEINFIEPVPAGSKVEIILDGVRNPNNGGMYYFNANIRTPGDIPLLRYIGTWVLTIN
jgi:hypothetical protein